MAAAPAGVTMLPLTPACQSVIDIGFFVSKPDCFAPNSAAMPFFKPARYALPRSRVLQNRTKRTGLRHTIFNTAGDQYVGEWRDDTKTGKGVILTRSDDLYEGDLQRDQRHGFGVLARRMPGTDVFRLSYRGDWKHGKMDGHGLRVYADGSFYIGDFRRGKRHGHGQQWYADGAFFDGEYQNDLREGLGLLVRADGNRYEGQWKADLKHGRGQFCHLKTGQLQEGVWNADLCAYSQMRDIDFRQCCIEPTPYPVPEVALLYANRVSTLAKERALLGLPHSCSGSFDFGHESLLSGANRSWGRL